MKVIVVGLGTQGHKRRQFAGADFVADVDPVKAGARYRSVGDVPLADYDAALVCTPDEPKLELLTYLLGNGKHVLVEKPLWTPTPGDLDALETLALAKGAVCYTAYNHRFEPHFAAMRDLLASGELGEIFSCRMFYGNGTARDVRESVWRDQGPGVIMDLGSHLLDTCRFWFGDAADGFDLITARRFENQAPDFAIIASETAQPRIELEMTLLMWRNHFTCDLLAEKGSAHIRSLCKWGPTSLTVRGRMLPSGRPPERMMTLTQADPTWQLEYDHFKRLCATGVRADLATDKWLLRRLGMVAAKAQGTAS